MNFRELLAQYNVASELVKKAEDEIKYWVKCRKELMIRETSVDSEKRLKMVNEEIEQKEETMKYYSKIILQIMEKKYVEEIDK